MEQRGLKEIPLQGIAPATLTVPGSVASWIAAHEAHGRLPLARVLESALSHARRTFALRRLNPGEQWRGSRKVKTCTTR